jgi:peptidoglycan/xylan/chitin deacetylase (PgdA/CDA1 family)
VIRAAILLAPLVCSSAAGVLSQAPPARTIAITMDDLPYVNIEGGDYVAHAAPATARILEALRARGAPAVGFVNENKLEGDAERRTALLQQWVDAGMTLANHTYSHPDFNARTIAEFQEEITRGEVVTRRLMKPRGAYQLYFRHPMTHTGDTAEKKAAIGRFLADRGYVVAPHTIENGDYVFNVGFARAQAAGDTGLAERLRTAYLDHTLAATTFAERMSIEIFGREIPQVLLIHTNAVTADRLPALLDALAGRGYRFVTLDEAMRDPAYGTPDSYVGSHGPTWLFRWSKGLGRSISFAGEPDPPGWVIEIYNRR